MDTKLTFPVTLSIERPARFDRAQVALRVLVIVLLSMLGSAVGGLFAAVYLALPIYAAVSISEHGSERYATTEAPRLTRWLGWLVELYAYLSLLTDRFPTGTSPTITYEVRPTGKPTIGRALLKLLYSLPYVIVLAVLSWIAWFVWVLSALYIVVRETYPAGLYDFMCGVVRWQARLFAYHASLVAEYPPFSLDTGPIERPALPPAPSAVH